MKDYGIVESSVKPEPIKIDEYSVWISTDITPFEKEIEGEMFVGYSYHSVQYDKDEYIMHQQQTIIQNQTDITDLQLALCEVAEAMEGQNG